MLQQNEIEVVAQGDEKAAALEAQVARIKAASQDAIAHTQTLRLVSTKDVLGTDMPENLPLEDRVVILAPGGLRVMVSDVAHDQMCTKLGIGKPYYQKMLASQPDLLADNVNRWLTVEPDKRLLRMISPLSDDEGQRQALTGATYRLRAFLSATYRPLDNAELVATILPVMKDKGAYLSDFSLTEQRLHAKFATVDRDVKELVTEIGARMGLTHDEAQRRHVIDLHEIVSMGVSIRNSETGFAMLDVSGLIRILKCTNYLIAPQETKVRHVGGRKNGNGDGELQFLSAQTQRLDNAAIFSRVRDTALALLDETKQFEYADRILSAKATIVEPEQPMFEFIGRIGENLGLTDAEADVLKEEVVRSNVIEGGFTQFSLSQGLTATARQMGDYDRRVELERAGWEIITSDATKLLNAGKAATKQKN